MIRVNFRAANRAEASSFAPVTTILPDENIRAVVFGSLILIITAAKRFGLYSAFLAYDTMFFKSKGQVRFTVATTFCNVGLVLLVL